MDAGGHDDPLFNYSPATVNALAAQIQANRFQNLITILNFSLRLRRLIKH